MHRTFLKTVDRWSTFWKSHLQTNCCYYLFFLFKIYDSQNEMLCLWRLVWLEASHRLLIFNWSTKVFGSGSSLWQCGVLFHLKTWHWDKRRIMDFNFFLKDPKKIRHCGYLEHKYISDAHIVRISVFWIVYEKCPSYINSVLWIMGQLEYEIKI